MPLPDLQIISEAGGYVVALGTLLGVLWLVVTGRLVPGSIHERETRRADALDGRVDALVESGKETSGLLRTVVALLEERQHGAR